MEMLLISCYVGEKFNLFKTFLIIDDDYSYFISTYNNRITVIKRCESDLNISNLEVAQKLAYSPEAVMPTYIKEFFDKYNKTMFKIVEI